MKKVAPPAWNSWEASGQSMAWMLIGPAFMSSA